MTDQDILKLLRAMMFTLFVFGVLLIVVLLVGCAGPYAMTHEADRTQACITVQWTAPKKIAAVCDPAHAFLHESQACIFYGQLIITRKPNGWGDEAALLSLGHEVYHALGAEH